ncbi:MAG: NAD(P)/FAD-dependent oxidoreductase [Anaeroplasmataceae bacterium]|nr:NAD(P)/FAD-dependent oxidoreductase [Anaeroplasmataceae bacterium]
MIYDAIIIGKGPAGISTAIYMKRYGYSPVILAKDGGALERVKEIENYYGIPSISGKELIELGVQQAKHLDIPIFDEEVIEITKETHFKVITNLHSYDAKTVVLACGTSRNRFTKADSFEGVSYCATCDGFFYRKKKVALIGSGAYMAHELSVLENICKDIIVFTNGKPLETKISSDITVITEPIVEVLGNTHIEGIKTTKETYPIEGCFIAIGNASGFTLAKHLGMELKGNSIVVNPEMRTNIEGLYACGDAVGGLLQVSKAVGEGAVCATSIVNYLKEHKN